MDLSLPDEIGRIIETEAARKGTSVEQLVQEYLAQRAGSLKEELRKRNLFRYSDGSAWWNNDHAYTWEEAEQEYGRQMAAGEITKQEAEWLLLSLKSCRSRAFAGFEFSMPDQT